MTKQELAKLPDGTLLYNGKNEGKIVTADGFKCIEILIPLYAMSNASIRFDERPEGWEKIDE